MSRQISFDNPMPAAIGTYSQAVRVAIPFGCQVRYLWIRDQGAGQGDMRRRCASIRESEGHCRRCGATFDDVVKATIFLITSLTSHSSTRYGEYFASRIPRGCVVCRAAARSPGRSGVHVAL